jgi:hypothetical protein
MDIIIAMAAVGLLVGWLSGSGLAGILAGFATYPVIFMSTMLLLSFDTYKSGPEPVSPVVELIKNWRLVVRGWAMFLLYSAVVLSILLGAGFCLDKLGLLDLNYVDPCPGGTMSCG